LRHFAPICQKKSRSLSQVDTERVKGVSLSVDFTHMIDDSAKKLLCSLARAGTAGEFERLAALKNYQILDTPSEPEFERFAEIAAEICGCPIALISLLDESRQWFKARKGLEVSETPREVAFCEHTIRSKEAMVVPDATLDGRFCSNPLVTGHPHIRFYAGAPLITSQGFALGTLCIIDTVPRTISTSQVSSLKLLAEQVVAHIELRTALAADRERAAAYKALTEAAPIGVFLTDTDGNCKFVNRMYETISGLTFQECLQQGWTGAIHPDDVERVKAEWIRASEEKKPYQSTHRFCTPSGKTTWCTVKSSAITDEGVVRGFVGTVEDISGRKLVEDKERELAANMTRQQNLLDFISTVQLNYITDSDPRSLFEGVLKKLLEVSESEYGFIGEVLFTNDNEPYLKTHALTNIAWNEETRNLYEKHHRDGLEFRNMDTLFGHAITQKKVVISNVPDEDSRSGGRPYGHPPLNSFAGLPLFSGSEMVGLIGLANREGGYDDAFVEFINPLLVTCGSIINAFRIRKAKERVEIELKQSGERLDLAMKAAEIGSWDWNIETGTVIFNEQWARMLGYELSEIQPDVSSWERLVHPDDLVIVREQLQAYFTGANDSYVVEHRLKTKDSGWKWIFDTGKIVERDKSGKPLRMVGIHLDVERRKLFEDELRAAKEAAEAANVAKTQFLANMSHEIRSPLTAIIGFTEALEKEATLSAQDVEVLKIILNNGQHLLGIINDILDLSKIDAGAMHIESDKFSPFALCEELRALFASRAAEKSLTFSIDYIWPLPNQICSDSLRLKQVLINLLGNAVKFTDVGEVRLEVQYSKERDQVQVSIIDSGIGLSHAQQERIFKPFSQADDSTTRRYGGTGLGLAISKQLIERLGGQIQIESTFGVGSRFTVFLPTGLHGETQLLTGPPRKEESEQVRSIPQAELSGRVLIVDDAIDNQKLLQFLLRKTKIQPTFADNGRQALELAKANEFDLILMDMQMPIMDGYTATRVLRERQLQVPVVALTANAMSHDIDRALLAGCTTHLAKPFSNEQLFELLHRLLPSDHYSALTPIFSSRMNTPDQINDLILEYLDNLPERWQEILVAVNSAEPDAIAGAAHKLRGSAALYGFEQLSGDCEILELRAETVTADEQRELVSQIERTIQAMLAGRKALQTTDTKTSHVR